MNSEKSGFSLFHRSLSPLSTMNNIATISINSSCFIYIIPVHFIHSKSKVSKYHFVFISLIFIFHIILKFFKETSPSQLLPGAMPWSGINTEKFAIRGSNLKGHKSAVWISVISVTQMKQDQQSFCVTLQERKKWGPINYFSYGVSVKILMSLLCFLQNSSARSCFKGSLIRPTLAYIIL